MIDVARRPEDQLLIESVMASIGQSDIVTTKRLLASDLDWTYLIRTASRHQVLPLLQRLLADCERVGATVEADIVFWPAEAISGQLLNRPKFIEPQPTPVPAVPCVVA